MYDDYLKLVRNLGAAEIKESLPSRRMRSRALILGVINDRDTKTVLAMDEKIWSRDLIASSILRGTLQLNQSLLVAGVFVKEERQD